MEVEPSAAPVDHADDAGDAEDARVASQLKPTRSMMDPTDLTDGAAALYAAMPTLVQRAADRYFAQVCLFLFGFVGLGE